MEIQRKVFGYGYVRVSTVEQKDNGVSLEAQKSTITEWAKNNNVTLIKIFDEGAKSGTKLTNRSKLIKLLDIIEENEILIVTSLDRISRATKNTIEIFEKMEEKDVKIMCIKENFDSSTPEGRLFFHTMAIVAEYTSDLASESTKEALAYMKTQNRALGKCPYGWKKASKMKGSGLIEIPEEQYIIQLILDKRERDICNPTSWHIIAKELNEEGIPPPPKAKMWYKSTIKRIAERSFDVNTLGKDNLIHYEE